MARDDPPHNTRHSSTVLNRRDYLQYVGTAAATLASVSTNGTATDYRTVTVPANTTDRFEIRDGDTLENLLIDVTADGANARVDARGDGWTVRNVGWRGSLSDIGLVLAGQHGTVENVYLGDGSPDNTRAIGVWIEHEDTLGPLTFQNVHIAQFANNGIYGSPTVDEYSGGVLHIRDSYFNSNNISGFKIGSPRGNCTVENTTIRTDGDVPPTHGAINPRAIWALDDQPGPTKPTIVRNCDIQGTLITHNEASLELKNTRWDGEGYGNVVGQSTGTPDLTPPSGVPMTPEEAAAGQASPSDPPTDGDSDDQQGTILKLMSGADTTSIDYTFTVDGQVSKHTVSNRIKAEDNDSITANDDGTLTVRGTAGNGYGDAYVVDGAIIAMDLDASKWTLTYGGDQVSVAELVVPVVERFTINESERLGDDQLYAVQWRVADATADLDTVEVVIVEETTELDFAVTDVSGESASGWELFQFPAYATLNARIRVTDADGNVTEQNQRIKQ